MEDTSIPNPNALMVAREWPTVMLVGIVTVVLGGIVLAWPSQTLTVLSIILGIQLLIIGLFRLISAFSSETTARGLTGFVGIMAMVAGVVVLRHPYETVVVLAVVLGVVWIVGGSIDLISAIGDSSLENRGWTAFGGLITLGAGIVIVAWPDPTVQVIAWIGGLYLVIFGLFLFFSALSLRHATKA